MKAEPPSTATNRSGDRFESPARSAVKTLPKPTYRSVIKLDNGTYITNPESFTRRIQRTILYRFRKDCRVSRYSLFSVPQGYNTLRKILATYDYVRCDIQSAYEQITYTRVVGLLRSRNFDPAEQWAVYCVYKTTLARGSHCSNIILEQILKRFDYRMAGLARQHYLNYIRYVDDFWFYGDLTVINAPLLMKHVRDIARAEGFALNMKKTHIEYLEQ